jgi:hypothetical protein
MTIQMTKPWLAASLLTLVLVLGLLFLGTAPAFAHGGGPFKAALSGANEVPAGDPDGDGLARVRLNHGQGRVCFAITVRKIDPVTAAHIHIGAAGTNGPVVVDFAGQLHGCVEGVDKDLIQAIRQNPSGYYVNVHTGEYPDGAVRGQLHK